MEKTDHTYIFLIGVHLIPGQLLIFLLSLMGCDKLDVGNLLFPVADHCCFDFLLAIECPLRDSLQMRNVYASDPNRLPTGNDL